MQREIKVNLGNLLLSLSEAIDLADSSLTQHQQRTAFIVWEMAKEAGMSHERMSHLFVAALLHDIGAFSLEEKIAMKNFEIEDVESHCIRGEILMKKIPWFTPTSAIIRHHHRAWYQWGGSIEDPLVFDSQTLYLADYLERKIDRQQYILHQHEDIIEDIKTLAGKFIHPRIVELFMSVCQREEFWLDLTNPRLYSLLLNEGPFKGKEISFSEITLISELFRHIIDFRSRFTSTHSSGVAAAAAMIAKIFGLSELEVKLMAVAGNLHDIGKLAIPNSILDKPGKLSKAEMELMKSHTYYTYMVINTIGGLEQIAQWAAYHHERLDGSGYPFHCTADKLNTGARIMMVADIFTALTEDRPYRKGLNRDEVIEILRQLTEKKLLDPKVIKVLLDNYGDILLYVSERQEAVRVFYETQFMDLIPSRV